MTIKLIRKIYILFLTLFFVSLLNIYIVNGQVLGNDKIHFIDVEGDAILLESNGKYALIDGGEDWDNPRGLDHLEIQGTEEKILNYIKNIAKDENGKVTLEFIVGTHAHSDHIGALDTIINDDDIYVKKAYIKEYNAQNILDYEVNNFDNQEVYNQTIEALKREKSMIIQNISEKPFKFGDFTIEILNTIDNNPDTKKGENENSLGIKVAKGNLSAFLSGDINNLDNDEERLISKVGNITLLKLGHHGDSESSSKQFIKSLSPKYAIATTSERNICNSVRQKLENSKTTLYATNTNNIIVADFGKSYMGLNAYKPVTEKWYNLNDNWAYVDYNGNMLIGWHSLLWNDVRNYYYFNEQGYMHKGWLNSNEKWYYLNKNGEMQKGWKQVDGEYYYLDEYGQMQIGWIKLNGIWYYLENSGKMAIGWTNINNKWYYFNNNGSMKTGWLYDCGNWYYLYQSGEMATNIFIDGWIIDINGVGVEIIW